MNIIFPALLIMSATLDRPPDIVSQPAKISDYYVWDYDHYVWSEDYVRKDIGNEKGGSFKRTRRDRKRSYPNKR